LWLPAGFLMAGFWLAAAGFFACFLGEDGRFWIASMASCA
jgi:hypothetical protein